MLYLPPDAENKQEKSAVNWPERFQELAKTAKHPALKRYYEVGIASADTSIDNVPMVAVDFETTGMNPDKHGIISIAVVPMTLSRIDMSKAQQWVVKPRRLLTEESVTIHGITHSEIEQAPDLAEIIDPLLNAVAGKVWVVHYNGIERPFLQGAFEERLNETIHFPLIDTMEIEARFHRQKRSLWDKLTGKKPVSIRLADSRERYNLPFYAPHDAMTDALACGELLQAQIAHHFSPETAIGDIWLP
ncbi:DNA polymerase III subunit epsilon [Idiomarina sp. WRN-38]|uniref:3'-5' exonuclease n=1 Tax=Idiomarina sp. OXR-189 TaxID=3100175 RepID=UPI000733653F|nr:3'-5' exonuclease [Idiomarina sp. OXR-189]KTG23554.1 DNA polymerase III subunit epsilon [Idiomarina sp. H105]OAE90946.1 DNA polymerase III subunit epsilon [Idiomarina sp. WRN-38]WPZ00321.1 3'-5' exonuclease [Idiomarina sp. OXR-189]